MLSDFVRKLSKVIRCDDLLSLAWPIASPTSDNSTPQVALRTDGMQISITRQELGRIVGCSREMVGRVLKALEDQHLITAKGKTIVVFGTR